MFFVGFEVFCLDERKVLRYLKRRGLNSYYKDWDMKDFKRVLEDIEFSDWETGCLRFCTAKSGRRYIQFLPGRCYID